MGQQAEARYVREWLQLFHPNDLQWRRVRLGRLPSKTLAKMYNITLHWADAIYVDDEGLHIVEAKMKPVPRALGQILMYMDLLPETPEFTMLRDKKVHGEILTTRVDPALKGQADKYGIDYTVYAPGWAVEVAAKR